MITIKGKASINYIVNIPVNSFSEIEEDNMSIKDSDEMIGQLILKKYGFMPDDIWVDKEVK